MLFTRILLKVELQEADFEDLIEIPFCDPENVLCRERLADKQEFSETMKKRYPVFATLIEDAKVQSARKRDLEAQCFQHIQSFIIQVVISLKERLPYQVTALKNSMCVYFKQIFPLDVWRSLSGMIPTIIAEEDQISYLDEVDSFSLRYKAIIQEHKVSGMNIIKRWKLLRNDYPNLSKVAQALMTIPYSSSTVESLFSEFKAYKTSYRNRLNIENLEASVMSEQYFRSEEPRVLPDMVDKYFDLWKDDGKPTTSSAKKTSEVVKGPMIVEVSKVDSKEISNQTQEDALSDFSNIMAMMMSALRNQLRENSNQQDIASLTQGSLLSSGNKSVLKRKIEETLLTSTLKKEKPTLSDVEVFIDEDLIQAEALAKPNNQRNNEEGKSPDIALGSDNFTEGEQIVEANSMVKIEPKEPGTEKAERKGSEHTISDKYLREIEKATYKTKLDLIFLNKPFNNTIDCILYKVFII